ncbi:O-methyltransferase-like protein [Vibrio sinaloensis DSM 21326]|uniref:O-methyltransferase-like protein n=1 Tax=Vibrio sinaloensis DSM 21326 TaxID=945550 RepID=E8M7Y5_PHOS4|nr:class I SAM-dependent methyltransferase [Vibrio sinaloensis]EGA69884.1 O-methyltransferase-like protein [Vibrio sinaloensis DSM 21326]
MAAKQKLAQHRYQIPASLLQPLWLRSRESLVDNGLVYDPIAARACQRCHLAPECFSGDIDQKQLLHVTIAQQCDQQVSAFIKRNPDGWILNVGAGLDTRFYRVDNGRCHWLELDVTENLLWRQKLFHNSERYHHMCGSVTDLSWLDALPIPEKTPVMIVCEHALLDCEERQVAQFIQALGCHFDSARACVVLAGDLSSSKLGQKMGAGHYAHGYASAKEAMLNYLPWARWVKSYSPLDRDCGRWKLWQRWLTKIHPLKQRLTPLLVQIRW